MLALNPEAVLVPTLISFPSIIKGAAVVDAPSQSIPILPTKSLAVPVIPIWLFLIRIFENAFAGIADDE